MNKIKLLTWAVVLLVVLNLTTIATIFYHNYNENAKKEIIVLGTESNNRLDGQFFRQTIGFNNSQMMTFREAHQEFQPKANEIILRIDSLKKEMFLELKKVKSDTVKLNNLSLETGALHAQLKRETNRFYLKIKMVCTPHQIEQLQTTFTPLFRNAACNGKGIGGRGNGQSNRHGFRNQKINK